MIDQEKLNELMKLLPPPQEVESDTYCLPITLFRDPERTQLQAELDLHFKKTDEKTWPGWVLTNIVPYKIK